jgi:glycosyltransferase involved in cell wall biosynthesis
MTRLHKGVVADSRVGAAEAEPVSADPSLKITYVSWAESCSRSDHTARELGGTSHMVYLGQLGSHPATILFKYAGQWLRTARLLTHERPDVVFTMTPPVFAALPALIYVWRRGKAFVIDAHTAAFAIRRWRHFQWLQRVLCRRARTTLVSNDYLAGVVRAAGGHATVVPDVPIVFQKKEPFPRPASFTVALVCSFDADEPIADILEAARQLPDIRFFMTGNPRHMQPDLRERVPQNVTLTGFLSVPAYGGLLTDADAVLALTTLDHTMLRSAYEAIYQGTPIIVSDSALLRQEFPIGAAHANNTSSGIVAAVRRVQQDARRYRAEAAQLRQMKLDRWNATRAAILARING